MAYKLQSLWYKLLSPGDEFEWQEEMYEVIKEERPFRCQYCSFYDIKEKCLKTNGRVRLVCSAPVRQDGNNVIFVKKSEKDD